MKTTRLICERALDSNELISYGSASSGMETITFIFKEGKFNSVSRDTVIKYPNSSASYTSFEKVKEEHHKSMADFIDGKEPYSGKYTHAGGVTSVHHEVGLNNLTQTAAKFFYMGVDNGTVVTDYQVLRRQYGRPSGRYACTREGEVIK